jgi:hypothetical protein
MFLSADIDIAGQISLLKQNDKQIMKQKRQPSEGEAQ